MRCRLAARSFDFGPYRHVVDVGGGTGALIAEVLRANPALRGTVVDLAEAVGEAAGYLSQAGVGDRCEQVAGNFFQPLPAGGDVFMLSRVLHNWSDQDAVTILRNVRAAMPDDGRLLIFERFLPEGDEYHLGKVFDLVMLVVLGGRERTVDEYADLLEEAGLQAVEHRPGPADVGLLVAAPRSRGKGILQ